MIVRCFRTGDAVWGEPRESRCAGPARSIRAGRRPRPVAIVSRQEVGVLSGVEDGNRVALRVGLGADRWKSQFEPESGRLAFELDRQTAVRRFRLQ
jgi:hypothetical protein